MGQPGYGAEAARIVESVPFETLFKSEDIAKQLAQRFAIPQDKARAVTNVKLKRMTDGGEIKRLQKGVYCKMAQTVFGPIAPDIDKIIIKSLTVDGEARIGYESGVSLLNRLGLTTLVPKEVEITTNHYGVPLPRNCHIKIRKPAAVITDQNWRYLQFIDAAEELPTSHIDAEYPDRLLRGFAEKQGLDQLTIILTARRYFQPRTVLRLTDLFMGE